MKKVDLLYEGKAKKVYTTEDPDVLIVDYKDDATAFNGLKKGTIVGKGAINNRMTNHIFKLLEAEGVPTHYIEELSDRETAVKKVEIVPLEVIIRNFSAGSFAKKMGMEEGIKFKCPTLEFSYKNDDLGDPFINKYYALSLELATEEEIDAELAYDAAHYDSDITFQAEYREATRSGLAVRKWMQDNGLHAATVNFLTLDICGLPKMPFIECCKIMERGQGYAGEGDVLTAGLVGALLQVYPNTTFTEMFCPDWEQDVILLSHMGESNPKLAQWKPLISDCPFNYNSCGDTTAMYNCLRKGKAVYVNLAPMQDHFTLIVSDVEMLDEGLERGAYRHSTQGWMKPCKPLPQFLKEFSLAGGTHHSALVYDANIEEIKAFGTMMGFEVIEIK